MANLLKDKKFWIVAGILVVIIVFIVLMVMYKKKKALQALSAAPAKTPVSPGTKTTTNTSTTTAVNSVFPLKQGSTGNAVKALQMYLNMINTTSLPKLTEDGVFGAKTLAMLQSVLKKDSVSKAELDSYTKDRPFLKIY